MATAKNDTRGAEPEQLYVPCRFVVSNIITSERVCRKFAIIYELNKKHSSDKTLSFPVGPVKIILIQPPLITIKLYYRSSPFHLPQTRKLSPFEYLRMFLPQSQVSLHKFGRSGGGCCCCCQPIIIINTTTENTERAHPKLQHHQTCAPPQQQSSSQSNCHSRESTPCHPLSTTSPTILH